MGSLKYIASETTPLAESEPAPEEPNPAPQPEPAPEETTPAPEPTPTPAPSVYGIIWWVWLIVAVAVVTTILNVVSLLWRHTM